MTHGKHILKTESNISIEIMCACTSSKYSLPNWKYLMLCCTQFPHIDIPSPKSGHHSSHICPTIRFHMYHIITCCNMYVKLTFNEKRNCQ